MELDVPKIDGQYLIIPKHLGSRKRKRRRMPHTEQELETMRRLCEQYAAENDEDYLIVKVVEEITRPNTGQDEK